MKKIPSIIDKISKNARWYVIIALLTLSGFAFFQSLEYRNDAETRLMLTESTIQQQDARFDRATGQFSAIIFLILFGVGSTTALTEFVMWVYIKAKGSVVSQITNYKQDSEYSLGEAHLTANIVGKVYLANSIICTACIAMFMYNGGV